MQRAETAAQQEPRDQRPLPSVVRQVVSGQGQELERGTKSLFEARHGRDLGDIRVHADPQAAASARAVGARAFATGKDIVFSEEAYRPETVEGQTLIAHEIAHTLETPQGAMGLRRDKDEGDTPIAANAMIGLPAGSALVVTRTMAQVIFDMVRSRAPDVAASLTAVSDQRATLVTSNANRVEIRFNDPSTLPAQGDEDAQTVRDLTLRLVRTDSGTFDFEITGQVNDEARSLYTESGLSAEAEDGKFILSEGSEPHLRLTPAGSATGSAQIEAYTAPYLEGQPAWVRSLAPDIVDLINLQALPPATEGDAAAEDAAQEAIERAAALRRPPASTLTVGPGITSGYGGTGPNFMVGGTYRYAFTPSDYGHFLQVPLQFDLMYVPTRSVLGAISSGIGSSLDSINIPLNVRLTAGLGGGGMEGEPDRAAPDAAPPINPIFGPTVGLGIGYQTGWFRVEVRGDLLFNVLPGPSPTVLPMSSLMLGGAF